MGEEVDLEFCDTKSKHENCAPADLSSMGSIVDKRGANTASRLLLGAKESADATMKSHGHMLVTFLRRQEPRMQRKLVARTLAMLLRVLK